MNETKERNLNLEMHPACGVKVVLDDGREGTFKSFYQAVEYGFSQLGHIVKYFEMGASGGWVEISAFDARWNEV